MDSKSDNFWEITYRQNIGKMIGVCCRYTQNRETAEDLAHDAFLVAIDKVASFENRGPFEAWLRRIVVNVALQYIREQKKKEILEGNPAYYGVYEAIQEENMDSENYAFSELELLETISYLPDHHRLVFNLYVVDHFTHAQIGAQLGISEGTSKSHLARARKKIRELLREKLREDKKRKRSILSFVFPFGIRDIDHFIAGKLSNLTLQPRNHSAFDHFNEVPVPKLKPTGIAPQVYFQAGIAVVSVVLMIVGFSVLDDGRNLSNPEPMIIEPVKSLQKNVAADSMPATISKNPIIVAETKNEAQMKNVSALGGLLVASLAFDSASLVTELPVDFRKREVIASFVAEPEKTESDKRFFETKIKLLSGTFYASKLLWSDVNSTLFLFGDKVKVDLNDQKFTGSGKFSFLNKIKYLVVDGVPIKLNETIKLEEKKYRLVQLNESDGAKKYGDPGKFGVVEITSAE
jgi:RNA polymerase sigma factor (sigma-70 family)